MTLLMTRVCIIRLSGSSDNGWCISWMSLVAIVMGIILLSVCIAIPSTYLWQLKGVLGMGIFKIANRNTPSRYPGQVRIFLLPHLSK